MLVTFKSGAYSDITMFGGAAVSLLKLMGQSGNVPGAILAEDIPEALLTLRKELAALSEAESCSEPVADAAGWDPAEDDDRNDPPVALHTRASPLVKLLEAAAAAGENVLWDS